MNVPSPYFKVAAWLLLLSLLSSVGGISQAARQPSWQDKVVPEVLAGMDGRSEFIVYLSQQADLGRAQSLKTKAEKGRYVFQRLVGTAKRTQKPVLDALAASGAEFRPYWIANMIWVRGEPSVVQRMAGRQDVARIYANSRVRFDIPPQEPETVNSPTLNAAEWNIERIKAPQVWARGYRGQGAVVGGQDTGYDWSHPALTENYRGWNGGTADHSYNWHDAIHEASGNNPCGTDTAEPCDDQGHGTHTMGIMVGSDPDLAHEIGVAPGAQWIGCRNMDQGVGTPITYSECYQWFLAPTDSSDQNPDPDRAPDVVNNSWGCPESEGCTDLEVLRAVVEAVRAAGILTVHAAGNDGPACSSIATPAAIYDASFTVGNTTSSDTVSIDSSRGPVTVDGSGRLKPDISAPGTSIYSSIPGDSYTWFSGTSMAAPHVSGLAALLISAQAALRGRPDELEELIRRFAAPVKNNNQTCGGVSGSTYPNNTAGWGRIDALASLEGHLLRLGKTASAAEVFPGDKITYTLEISHQAVLRGTHNVVLTDAIPAHTDFVSATGPYSFSGSQVRWDFAELERHEYRTMQLTVQVGEDFTGTIANDDYRVSSDEVTGVVTGEPVYTEVVPVYEVQYAPLILRVPWIESP